jgi:hypothetical protein
MAILFKLLPNCPAKPNQLFLSLMKELLTNCLKGRKQLEGYRIRFPDIDSGIEVQGLLVDGAFIDIVLITIDLNQQIMLVNGPK